MGRPTRRDFFAQSTALALAASSTTSAALPRRGDPIRIVDAHQHLWDRSKFRLPWIKKGSTLDRDFVMKDYDEAVKGLNVVKAVYMEVDVDPKQQVSEAKYVIDLCRRADTTMAAAVISGRPDQDIFAKYVARFKDSAYIKGIRQVLHGDAPAGHCLKKEFIRGIQLLGDNGLSFDLCMRPGELPDAAKLISTCPDTRFILDHCGNAPVQTKDLTKWKKDISALAKNKNVVGKISGIVASLKPGEWKAEDLAPAVNHTLDTFGPDRVMFAGDWPVCTLAATFSQWVNALKSIVSERPREEQIKLFHDNAVRFYGLKDED
jgi:predicted TIM-barrel fold metal-dependent hydrolase